MSDEAPPPYPGPKKAEDTPADGSETNKTQTEEPFDNSKLPPPPPYSAVPGAEPTRPQIFIAGLSTPITISPDATRVQLSTEASPEQPEKIENYLLLSICSMIFCCFPLGVLATLLSCQVGILFQRGDYLHARIISQRARHVASMAIMIGCFMIFVDYFRRYNFGLDYGTNGMDGTMNPKIYATSDVDYTSSETPGAAFQPTDPFSETDLDSYTGSFRVQEVQDEDSWHFDPVEFFFGSEGYNSSVIQDGFNPGPLVSQPEISVDDSSYYMEY